MSAICPCLAVAHLGTAVVAKVNPPRLIDEAQIRICEGEFERLALPSTHRLVVISLRDVEYVSACALGCLIKLASALRSQDRHLILCCARPEIRAVLEMTHIREQIPLVPDEAAALAYAHYILPATSDV